MKSPIIIVFGLTCDFRSSNIPLIKLGAYIIRKVISIWWIVPITSMKSSS